MDGSGPKALAEAYNTISQKQLLKQKKTNILVGIHDACKNIVTSLDLY